MSFKRLKEHRKANGLTQAQLGKLVGVSGAYIQQLEKGVKSNASHEVILKICKTLKITPQQLLDDDEVLHKLIETNKYFDLLDNLQSRIEEINKLVPNSENHAYNNLSVDESIALNTAIWDFLQLDIMEKNLNYQFVDIFPYIDDVCNFLIKMLTMKIREVQFLEMTDEAEIEVFFDKE